MLARHAIPFLTVFAATALVVAANAPPATAALRDSLNAHGTVDTFTVAGFLDGRRCWVYLPAGYARFRGLPVDNLRDAAGHAAREARERYPVLYMHDGQNLFDARASSAGEWRVDETCDRLIAAGEIRPLIVIGIDNGGARRMHEYTPWPDARHGAGGGADEYLAAIRDVLIPEVNRRYRTFTGPSHTWLAGSSLGGLVSAYAAFTFDSTFGRIGAVSTSFWWADHALARWAAQRPRPRVERFYQDMGAMEGGKLADANGNGLADELEDLRVFADVMRASGFRDGVDLKSHEAPGHRHHETYWAQRLPGMLKFLDGGGK